MFRFIMRRLALMIPTLILVSIASFAVIELPPGDYVSRYVQRLVAEQGAQNVDQGYIDALRAQFGVGEPLYVKYAKWMSGLFRGDLGRSWELNRPVMSIIREKLPISFGISLATLLLTYIVAIPIGIFSATHKYTPADYLITAFGFFGMAIPGFFAAIILLWWYFKATGQVQLGLFSREYAFAPWSVGRLADLAKHLILPVIVIGLTSLTGLIRIMRANLMDELAKPYVTVALAKGLSRRKMLYKYPVRIAINPIVSTIGWSLPALVGGELIVSMVLGLPTLAPIFTQALLNQDMYLAGSSVFFLSVLTVIGTLLSDILLAYLDPRIRQSV